MEGRRRTWATAVRIATVAGLCAALGADEASAEAEAEIPEDAYFGDGHVYPGQDEAESLARAVQNPVADLISVADKRFKVRFRHRRYLGN